MDSSLSSSASSALNQNYAVSTNPALNRKDSWDIVGTLGKVARMFFNVRKGN